MIISTEIRIEQYKDDESLTTIGKTHPILSNWVLVETKNFKPFQAKIIQILTRTD